MATAKVVTVKVAWMVPAGTSTLPGTAAAGSLLESETSAPALGAGPFSVTVPREEFRPPVTLVGFSVSEAGVGRGEGATVSAAPRVTPPKDAEIVTAVAAATGLVVTVKVALVAPAGTVTLPGARAIAGVVLESVTCAPPAGAGPLSATVPVEGFPPITLVGLSVSEERVGRGGGVTVSAAPWVTPP